MRIMIVTVLLIGVTAASAAGSQTAEEQVELASLENLASLGQDSVLNTGIDRLEISPSRKSYATITTDGESGRAEIGFNLAGVWGQNMKLTLSSPFDKETKVASFGLDGLSDATKIGFSWSRVSFGEQVVHDALTGSENHVAKALNLSGVFAHHDSLATTALAEIKSKLEVFDKATRPDSDNKQQKATDAEKLEMAKDLLCKDLLPNSYDRYDCLKKQWPTKYDIKAIYHIAQDILGLAIRPVTVTAWVPQISAEYGVKHFSYSNPDDISAKATKTREDVYSATASITKLMVGWSATLGYRYEQNYKAKDPVQICTPYDQVTNATRCHSITLAAPSEQTSDKVFVNLRWLSGSAAWGFTYTKDFENEKDYLEIPVHFNITGDKTNGANAGLIFSYNTEDKEWVSTVFIGKPFSWF